MIQLSQQVSISELANTQGLVARVKLCRNTTLQRTFLESSGCCSHVQSRSRTKCVEWLAKFEGIAAIHAVFPAVRNVEQEESVKLEYQSSDSQEWPDPSSPGVSEAECPDCE